MSGLGLKNNQFKGGGAGGGVVKNLQLGETFDVSSGPLAAYPKVIKQVTFTSSDNIIAFDLGNVTITADVVHYYPYTALKSEIETQMGTLGYTSAAVIVSEQHWKISADESFTINKAASNSATTKMGFVAVDTATAATFFRADSIHTFVNVTQLFKTNTDDDLSPPTIDDGILLTQVPADHRARSFSGFVDADGVRGDVVTLKTEGEVDGTWAAFTDVLTRYINGTAGEISTAQVTNSLLAGTPRGIGETVFVIDPTDKGFTYQVEPDTDVSPDTTDGVFGWETLPEYPQLTEDDVSLHDMNASGDNVIVAQVGANTIGELVVSYSTDKGLTFKKATFNGLQLGPNTRASGNWGDSVYHFASPSIAMEGNKVFIAYLYNNGATLQCRGVAGVIDSNGNLNLIQSLHSNGGSGILNPLSGNITGLMTTMYNGVVYVTGVRDTNRLIKINSSGNGGFVFDFDSDGTNIKNAGNAPTVSQASGSDFQPRRLAVVDVPGQPTVDGVIYNNDFEVDIAGWNIDTTAGGGGSAVQEAGALKGQGAGAVYLRRNVSGLTIGKTYAFRTILKDFGNSGGSQSIGFYARPGLNKIVTDPNDGKVSFTPTDSMEGLEITLLFTATNTDYTLFIQNDGAAALDNRFEEITLEGATKNRVAVVSPCTSNGVASCYNNLFYTDDQNIGNSWSTALNVGEDLGATYHLPIGSYLHSDDKWYIHTIAGHASANFAGGTTRVGNTDAALISEIDLAQVTPVIQKGVVDWGSAGAVLTDTSNGYTSANSNGLYFFNSPNSLIKTDDGVWVTESDNNADSFLALITDMSDVANNTDILRYNDFSVSARFHSERQLAFGSNSLQLITKKSFNGGDTLSAGKIEASEIVLDQTAKPELITNGTFDTDISGWTALVGSPVWNAGRLRLNPADQAQQIINTEIGKTYILTADQFQISAPSFGYVDIRDINDNALNAYICTLGTESVRISFTATTSTTKIQLEQTIGGGIVEFDNVSVQEPSIQLGTAADLIDKPNVDEEGFAGRVRLAFDNSTIHISTERELPIVDDTTDVEQIAYNNFGLKNINVTERFETSPTEFRDNQSIDTQVFGLAKNGTTRVMVQTEKSTVNTKYYFSEDEGVTWDLVTTQANGNSAGSLDYEKFEPAFAFSADGNECNIIQTHDGFGSASNLGFFRFTRSGGVWTQSHTGTIISGSGPHVNYMLHRDGTKVVATWRSSTNFRIAVSTDGGQTFGTSVTVKNGGSTPFTTAGSPSQSILTPGGRIGYFGFDGSTQALKFWYTDDDGATWASEITLTGAVGNHFPLSYHLDGIKLAILGFEYQNPSTTKLFLLYCLDIDAGTPTFPALADIEDGVGLHDEYHGNGANDANRNAHAGVARRNGSKIRWKGATEVHCVWDRYNGAQVECLYTKIPDVTNVATRTHLTVYGDSTNHAQESQFMDAPSGQEMIVTKICSALASGLSEGQILHSRIDYTNFTATPMTQVTNKVDLTNFAGKMIVADNLLSFFKDNANGFEGIFTSEIKEQQINVEAEEFRQVPVKTTTHGNDVTLWGYDRSGDDIVMLAQTNTTGLTGWASYDGGLNWVILTLPSINTGINPNNTANYYDYNPRVIIEGDEACLAWTNNSTQDVKAMKLSKVNGAWVAGSEVVAINLGTIPQDIRLKYDSVNGKLFVSGRAGSGTVYTIAVSSDFGATWGSAQTVKNGGSNADPDYRNPIHMELVDLGSGNTRVFVIGTSSGSLQSTKIWYSDDDGATWASEISMGGTAGPIYGVKKFGNKLALAIYSFSTQIKLTVCSDMTAATPVFPALVTISDSVGPVDTFCGYTVSDGNYMQHNKMLMNRVAWINSSSLYVSYDRDGADTWKDGMLAYIGDTSNIAGSLETIEVYDGNASESVQVYESQLVKSNSGAIHMVSKYGNGGTSNNLSSGSIRATEIKPDQSLGQALDVSLKPVTAVGGFAGRVQVSGDTIIFEKEDGSSIENLYFNSITLRKVQKG